MITPFFELRQEELFYIVGIIGFLLYMVAFAGLQLQLLDGNGYAYTTINITAASFVLIGLTHEFNMASALIQISWITIGLVGIAIKIHARQNSAGPEDSGTPDQAARKAL